MKSIEGWQDQKEAAHINAEIAKVLDRLETECIEELPMSSGDNIAFIRLSAIQAIRKEYEE